MDADSRSHRLCARLGGLLIGVTGLVILAYIMVRASPSIAGEFYPGDVDCSAAITAVDALKVLRANAGLPVTQIGPEPDACPNIGTELSASGWLQGDVDCSGGTNAVDALRILRYSAYLYNAQPAGCPPIGPNLAPMPTPTPIPSATPTPAPTPQPTPAPKDTLYAGQWLYPGQFLLSQNQAYKLIMQTDGNLVLYSASTPLWHTNTSGIPATGVTMQSDGNLVIYKSGGGVSWNSGTGGHPSASYRLVDQNDSNLVVYSPTNAVIWTRFDPPPPPPTKDTLYAGQWLYPGQFLLSQNQAYMLIMQTDGNLVLYAGSTALWHTNTGGIPATGVTMQSDGNLVIYKSGGGVSWNSASGGPSANYRLIDQNDGNLVIYSPTNTVIWTRFYPPPVPFGDGTWVVGSDIRPGTYRNSNSSGGCYWERLSGFSGQLDDIIANNFTYDIQTVTIKPGDAGFSSEDCGTWSQNFVPPSSGPTQPFGAGTWFVGSEVAPGLWRNSDSSGGCYWERLSGFGGQLSDIIANNFTYSIQTVRVYASDIGFSSEDCGVWTRIGD